MSNKPIGVFDSGVGGLTVVRELRRQMPNENIVYFGDTGRNPYGTRSKETIQRYSRQAVGFLMKHDVKAVVAACGTASTVLLDDKSTQEMCPGIPFSGIVLPATRTACTLSAGGRVGVIATSTAIRTGAYGRAVRSISPSVKVFGNACPLLVSIVENGLTAKDNQIARLAVEMYLAPLIREEIDTLILGCTHFPLLYDIINDVLEYKVTLIDPAAPTARELQTELMRRGILNESGEAVECVWYFSDSQAAEGFDAVAKAFLQEETASRAVYVPVEEIERQAAATPK